MQLPQTFDDKYKLNHYFSYPIVGFPYYILKFVTIGQTYKTIALMKTLPLFLLCLLAGFFSCNSEEDWLNSFPTLDDEQYSFYVAQALDAMNMPRPEGSYNYPCLPGMDSWKELKSGEEKAQVCLVPEKILKKQSTQAVIQAIWEYPNFPMFHYLSSTTCMQQIVEQFLYNINSYQELINRSDAGSCLVIRYYRMNMTKVDHSFYNNSLQLLLSQTVFLDQLSLEEKVQLAKEMVGRIDVVKKVLDAETSDELFSINSSYFCLVRIMANSGYSPMLVWMEEDESAQEFEKSGNCAFLMTSSFRTKIMELSSNFIN